MNQTIPSTTVKKNETLLTNQTTTESITNQTEQHEERTEETRVTSSINQITPLRKRTADSASTNETPISDSHSSEKHNSTVYEEATETPIIEQTSKEDVESSTQNNVTDINDVKTIDDSRNSIDTNEKSQNNILNDTSSTMSSLSNDIENSTSTKYDSQLFNTNTNSTLANDIITRENETRDNYSVAHNYTQFPDEKFSTSTLSKTYITNVTSSTVETATSFDHSTTSYDTNFSSIILSDENTNGICNSSYCRQIASKMISYMNYSADPCVNFYEYACGGFKANPLLIDVDQARRFSNYQRIKSKCRCYC